jgi:hypothetical protein
VQDLKALGAALASLRVQAGFVTHEAAATATGIERATIVRHEQGKGGVPHARTLGTYERHYQAPHGLLRRIMEGRASLVSESVPRGTSWEKTAPSFGRALSAAEREYLAELRLRLTRAGVDVEAIERAETLLKSPSVFSYFAGGGLNEYSEEDVLNGMRSMAEDVIIPRFRDKGLRIP